MLSLVGDRSQGCGRQAVRPWDGRDQGWGLGQARPQRSSKKLGERYALGSRAQVSGPGRIGLATSWLIAGYVQPSAPTRQMRLGSAGCSRRVGQGRHRFVHMAAWSRLSVVSRRRLVGW